MPWSGVTFPPQTLRTGMFSVEFKVDIWLAIWRKELKSLAGKVIS